MMHDRISLPCHAGEEGAVRLFSACASQRARVPAVPAYGAIATTDRRPEGRGAIRFPCRSVRAACRPAGQICATGDVCVRSGTNENRNYECY